MHNEAAFILKAQRWDIISTITKGQDCATTIAEKLNLSVAYVNTQLKLLEAAGYLKKEKRKKVGIGKPRTHYRIAKELAIMAAINQQKTQILILKPQKHTSFIFNTLFLKSEEELYYLQKFYYTHEDLVHGTEMMALIETKEDGMHFLVITPDVERFREQYSNVTIKSPLKKEMRIVMWSHTKEEVMAGLKSKEAYYTQKVHNATPYWERAVSLEDLRKAMEEAP